MCAKKNRFKGAILRSGLDRAVNQFAVSIAAMLDACVNTLPAMGRAKI
jgi:hypothetical protein